MTSFFDSGPLPEWAEIKRWLGSDLPWEQMAQWDQVKDTEWLSGYINKMMSTAGRPAKKKDDLQIEIRKDAQHLVVTMHMNEATAAAARGLRLHATSERLKIMGLPQGGTRTVRFPCAVYPGTGQAKKKQGRLIIRFKRRPPDRTEYELSIYD